MFTSLPIPMFAAGEIESGSVIVAVVLLVCLFAIMLVAVFRFEPDGVLKLWGGLGSLIGLVVGTMGTYFFTRAETVAAQAQKMAAIVERDSAIAARDNAAKSLTNIAMQVEKAKPVWETIEPTAEHDPAAVKTLQNSLDSLLIEAKDLKQDDVRKMLQPKDT